MAKHSGKRNRTAGHNFERQIIKELKALWPQRFGEAKSTRSESKNLDDKGVDIMDAFGYYFQCKNTCLTPNYEELLERMPQAGPIVNVVMHKKTKKCGTKFMPVGEYAIMTKADFYKMILRIQSGVSAVTGMIEVATAQSKTNETSKYQPGQEPA
jgi:hypothetical protein